MTDADYFYDKLLASIGLPSDEPQVPGRKEPSRDQEHSSIRGERGGPQTPKPPPEPQHHPKPEPLPQQKSKQEPKKQKQDPGSKPQLELRRNAGSSTFTLPPKPTISPAELREKLARPLERPPPQRSPLPPPQPPPPPPPPPPSQPHVPVIVTKLPSGAPSRVPHVSKPTRPKAEEPCKTPAALEAELRRKLLENGLRKRKSSPPPGGRVMNAEGNEKRQKTTPPPPLAAALPIPQPPPLSPPHHHHHPVITSAVTESGSVSREPTSGADLKSRQAELRRKLLERSNNLKQRPSAVQTNGDTPNHKPDPTRKINRSYSPIEISSDEECEAPPSSSKSKMLSSFPSFLPPRPPPREGFKLRISIPLPKAPNACIILKTEKLPLSTSISSILELFSAARDGDHLYFPGSNPKQTAETESGEKADLVLGEEGQRFYRDGDDTGGRDGGVIKKEEVTPPRPVTKKEDGWNPRSAESSLKGATSSLRGDAIDYVPRSHFKGAEVAEPQWAGISATLEDVWTRGKKVVDCTLVRAEEPEDDQDEDHDLPENHLEDRGNSWNPHHQHRHSRSDFPTGTDQQWGEDQNGEEGELEGDEEGDGEGWGYNEGYPESGEGGPNSMNWGPGYSMGQGHAQGSWNPEFPMIPNTNIPDPSAQWYSGQYQHSAQPSPVFSQHDEGQGSAFLSGTAPAPQAMHWVPGHMDYANAGWVYGFGPNDIQQNVGMGPGAESTDRPPSTVDEVNKVVVDGKLPGPAQSQQQPQQPRVQVGPTKPKRPRGGRQVKKKERRKGGSSGGGVGRSGGSVNVAN